MNIEIQNNIDNTIMRFCEKIAEDYCLNKWCLFAIHKWGDFDINDNIIQDKQNLFLVDQNNEIFATISNWKVYPC